MFSFPLTIFLILGQFFSINQLLPFLVTTAVTLPFLASLIDALIYLFGFLTTYFHLLFTLDPPQILLIIHRYAVYFTGSRLSNPEHVLLNPS